MFHQLFLAIIANVTNLFVSSFTLFLLPRWLPVSQYNYFQLYLFYAAYLPYLHFGLADGIYLRYGGYNINQLDRRQISGQFWFVLGLCVILATLGLCINHEILFQYLAIALFLTVPKIWISYLLQTMGQIKAYTRMILLEKLSYALAILLFGYLQILDVHRLIWLDLTARFLGFIYSIFLIRKILSWQVTPWTLIKKELKANWLCGIQLMLATLSGALMIGFVRWGIEKEWDLYTFGQVSLALSLANLITILIQSMSMVLFPILKRLSQTQLAIWYPILRNALTFVLVFLLIIYYPLQHFIAFWLPQYQDSLFYLSLIFPLCLFESKMSMIINTYLKAMRKENIILKANLFSLGLSLILSSYCIFVVHQLTLAVLNIVVIYAFRCIYCEYHLYHHFPFNLGKDLFFELSLVTFFILGNLYFDWLASSILYLSSLIVYLICKKKDYIQIYRLYRKEAKHALHANQSS